MSLLDLYVLYTQASVVQVVLAEVIQVVIPQMYPLLASLDLKAIYLKNGERL